MTAHEEASKIPGLQAVGLALLQYAETLFPSCTSEICDRLLVIRPNNFAAFTFQSRARTIRISLRGYRREFEPLPELPIVRGRSGYSMCVVQGPHQLFAAVSYLRQAADIYVRRTRKRAV